MLAVVARRTGGSPLTMTVGTFWIEVARMGGYLARSHHGLPGCRTIWKAGPLRQRSLKAFTLLFISVCKMWVRIGLQPWG